MVYPSTLPFAGGRRLAKFRDCQFLNQLMNPKAEFKNRTWLQFKKLPAIQTGVLLLCLAAASSMAQTHTVTSCTEAALRASLRLGGTVTFACDGTIMLNNTIVIQTNSVLDGSGHQITISGGHLVRVFLVNSNVNFTLIGLTIANGLSTNGYGGGIYNAGGNVNVSNCAFSMNVACGPDGTNGTPPGIIWTPPFGLGGPGGDGSGGAIYNAGSLNVSRCMFSQNSASGGRGGDGCPWWFAWEGGEEIAMNAGAGGPGGAANGGAICNVGVMAIDCSLFASNTTVGGTGGSGGDGCNTHSTMPSGGGTGSNGGDSHGSAILNGGAASMVNCTIAGNHGSGGAGGIGGQGGSFSDHGYFFFSGGGSGGDGGNSYGGIYSTNMSVGLTNCTVAYNSDTGGGGAAGGANGGGRGFGPGGSNGVAGGGLSITNALLVNTILAGNSPGNCSGTTTDAGHNLSSDGTCAFTNVGSLNNTDPKLGPLADNGGPTMTMALLPGSPAINAGDTAAAPPTDQRGFPRPSGLAADIGAYEYASPDFSPLPSQTTEMGSTIEFMVVASGDPVLSYQWFFDGNPINAATNADFDVTDAQFSQSGSYTVVVANSAGAVTIAPVMLNVIAPVARRPVPGVKVMGEAGSLLNVDYLNPLSPVPNWALLGTVSLTSTSRNIAFDVTVPLPPARLYRARQTGTPGVVPSLNPPGMVTAITLTGNVGNSLRLDCINQFGPTNAWVTLGTITLTNASQLYFDVSAIGQPPRLYRMVPVP